MKTKDLILKLARSKKKIKNQDIVKLSGISRQTAAQHLRELITSKKLVKLGSTHNAVYVPFSKKLLTTLDKEPFIISRYKNKNLNEHSVFLETALKLKLSKRLSSNVYRIAEYAFTEMFNNAIEHSKSKFIEIAVGCLNGEFEFKVSDTGIGAYENIRNKFHFKNHFQSVEHLLKGKQTTAPARHSGQGIFFTSKISDCFILESAKLKLIIDNELKDEMLEDIKFIKGTRVLFRIKQRSRKDLRKLIEDFQNDDYEFDKTKVIVHLSEKEGEHVSRSEAKRLLFKLDKFKRIILDFKKVKGIGQGFSDEIFRVYQNSHKDTLIEAVNVSPSIEFMIKRAKS